MRGTEYSMTEYQDIIGMEAPVSKKHPRMDRQSRAAQFLPFAALSGYQDMLDEAVRKTETRRELFEEDRAELDRQLTLLQQGDCRGKKLRIYRFVPDEAKEGGRYEWITGELKRVDAAEEKLFLKDGTMVPLVFIDGLELCDGSPDESVNGM